METLRAVLVGCGRMSAAWLDAARTVDGLALAGLVDLDEAAARARAEEFELRGAAVGSDLEAMLDHLRPDLVFDCTVPEAHVHVATAALRRGCHVLGEKPLADSMEHAREIVRTAAAAGRLHAVIQNRRYDDRLRRWRRLLTGGTLGTLTTLHSDFFLGPHFGGFRDRMEHVLLLDMAIHTFDAARFLTGANPVSVFCREWNPEGSWYRRDASAVCLFEMTGGLVYTYRGSWCAEGLNSSWEAEWRALGSRGSATWNGHDGFRAEVAAGTGGFFSEHRPLQLPEADPGDRTGGHAGLLREFVECVRGGGTPETVASDNIKSLAMVFAAIESARSGRMVPVEWW